MAKAKSILERTDEKIEIKGDAGKYEVWAVDWLNQRIMVYRAGTYEWHDFNRLKNGK